MAITGEQLSAPGMSPDAPATAPVPSASSGGRISTFVTRVQDIDARNTFQVALGAFLVPIGLLIILISWYGAAHAGYVQQQIPYLVSGSFIGLGLMIIGGLLYWAHWLYRIYDQADLHHAAATARHEELMERLIEAVTVAGVGGAAGVGAAGVGAARVGAAGVHGPGRGPGRGPAAYQASAERDATNGADGGLVATASGANVHRPDCPIVARHSVGVRRLTRAQAAERPLCRICQPDL